MRTIVGALAAVALCSSPARAEDGAEPLNPAPSGTTWFDLRFSPGDAHQDEVAHYGLFPSLVLGQQFVLGNHVSVEAAVAASKITAAWENIGGVSTAYLGLRRDTARSWLATGLTVPLDRTLPAPACFPVQPGGDSLTYAFGEDPGCWDRSAYRRAALHRGYWNAWMWAPDWISMVMRAGTRWRVSRRFIATLEGGVGSALPRTAGHAGVAALVQGAYELRHDVPGRQLGVRLQVAGVFKDDTSPLIVSAESFARWRLGRYSFEARFTLPLEDLSNDDVPPGLGGYRIMDQWSLGLGGSMDY